MIHMVYPVKGRRDDGIYLQNESFTDTACLQSIFRNSRNIWCCFPFDRMRKPLHSLLSCTWVSNPKPPASHMIHDTYEKQVTKSMLLLQTYCRSSGKCTITMWKYCLFAIQTPEGSDISLYVSMCVSVFPHSQPSRTHVCVYNISRYNIFHKISKV